MGTGSAGVLGAWTGRLASYQGCGHLNPILAASFCNRLWGLVVGALTLAGDGSVLI